MVDKNMDAPVERDREREGNGGNGGGGDEGYADKCRVVFSDVDRVRSFPIILTGMM